MITFLRGQLIEKNPVAAIIDVGGVGYEVFIPLSTYETLPEDGQAAHVLTRLIVREDSQQLYGFGTEEERVIFDLLISLSGIGPRLALAVLSGMTVRDFTHAVRERNDTAITIIPGIGKKTAARIVLELAEKISRMSLPQADQAPPAQPSGDEDEQIITALISLGFNRPEAAAKLAKSKMILGSTAGVEELIKAVLRS